MDSQPALRKHHAEGWKPGPQFETDADLVKLAGDIAQHDFPSRGNGKNGAISDPLVVTDSRLRVMGIDGLRIVGTSVMPCIASGNTNSPMLLTAEKAARLIQEDARLATTV